MEVQLCRLEVQGDGLKKAMDCCISNPHLPHESKGQLDGHPPDIYMGGGIRH